MGGGEALGPEATPPVCVRQGSGSCDRSSPHVEFLVVQLGELAQHRCGLVLVLGHGAGQSLGAGRADGLLVVSDVSDQQGAKVRDQLQVQGLPQPEQ